MLLLANFGVQAVQPVVTLYVQHLVGPRPELATLGGIAFSVTGVADLIASPFLGRRSDVLGYRRVLLICLGGAALASAPQAFVHTYWGFVAARFGLGLFVGGILPTANALVGRLAPPGERGLVYGIDGLGDVPRRLARPAFRRRDRGDARAQLGVPGHRRPAAREPALGLREGAGSALTGPSCAHSFSLPRSSGRRLPSQAAWSV